MDDAPTKSDPPFQPAGFASVTPYLIVRDAAAALQWYAHAFAAQMGRCLKMPEGQIAYAEFRIGDSMIMLSDEDPMFQTRSPPSFGGSPVSIHLYVPDADVFVERAAKAGASIKKPVSQQFHGARSGAIHDPYGHLWIVSTQNRQVDDRELEEQWRQICAGAKEPID